MRKQVWWSIFWMMMVGSVVALWMSGCISRPTYPTGDRPPAERTAPSDAATGESTAPDTTPTEQSTPDNKPAD